MSDAEIKAKAWDIIAPHILGIKRLMDGHVRLVDEILFLPTQLAFHAVGTEDSKTIEKAFEISCAERQERKDE